MTRMMAIVEREMRKFFRSPTLMMVSMMLPLVQLVILGNAIGRKPDVSQAPRWVWWIMTAARRR